MRTYVVFERGRVAGRVLIDGDVGFLVLDGLQRPLRLQARDSGESWTRGDDHSGAPVRPEFVTNPGGSVAGSVFKRACDVLRGLVRGEEVSGDDQATA
jgi:hypothetical protein